MRIIFPVIAGVSFQIYHVKNVCAFTLMPASLLLLLAFRFLPLTWKYKFQQLHALIVASLLFATGAILLYEQDPRNNKQHYTHHYDPGDKLLLHLHSAPEQKGRFVKYLATIQAVYHQQQWMSSTGEVMTYADTGLNRQLQRGSRLITDITLLPVRNMGNPGGFDYQWYCITKGIYHQAFLKQQQVFLYTPLPVNKLDMLLQTMLDYCLRTFRTYIGNGPEAGMAAALLIGYRQDLDKNIVQDYTNTGIVHVIAISGMHLALLYGSLLWLLQWLPASRYANWLRAFLIILFLWGFTLLTGSSASVLRAAVMFTATTIGRFVLQHASNIYNTLAASVFLLICMNPYIILDTGFQLSYLAVLSIVLFYSRINQLFEFKQRWKGYLWEMIALSVAAQILTTPVCLYYFHQFPTWFLLANLLAVPLSTIVIYGEIVLLAVAPFHTPAMWVGTGVKYLIWGMDTIVQYLGKLPGALITAIPCDLLQVVLLYMMIGTLLGYIALQFKPFWWLMVISTAVYIITLGRDTWQRSTRHLLVVYNSRQTAADYIRGYQYQPLFYTDSTGGDVISGRQYFGADQEGKRLFQCRDTPGGNTYLQCAGKKIVIIDSNYRRVKGETSPIKKFKTDYILLTRNPHVDIRQLADFYEIGTVIIGAGNPVWRIQRWKNDCYVLTLRFISVPDQGAYVINF
ncbi:ComEC/Rec2 family competence protein [Chitinophaga sp. Cy-1792]|uniref:ComEC/Rec2 family competence protein n=1 Tax=Chitinophaga sp. Cy-1792 TaxID=2608339 RepID=UPI00141E73FF|nr:ComEC/Rec2 family competence protein [Chitinophaga sp. Cy-1792]